MEFIFFGTAVSTKPRSSVELLVVVDRKTIQVEFDRWALQQIIGASRINDEAAREFLWNNRRAIELAIKAHLFARGIPLARQLFMPLDELHALHPA
ncbi:MAG: hypothetical protein ACREYB_04255 [Casimicrobiaceae bacterium]